MGQASSSEVNTSLTPWEPHRAVRKVDGNEVRLSRGFLRCRPERWFPGFPAHWLPLAHSLGVEFRVIEVKPVIAPPRGLKRGYACSVDDEPLAIWMDDAAATTLLENITPGAGSEAMDVVAEYLARRLLVSLEASWSGPESAVVRFESEKDPTAIAAHGAVKFTVDVHGTSATVWVVLGKLLVERLDGLWRRQVRSAARAGEGTQELQIEIAQLAVPPAMLVEYLKAGTVIDLEAPVSDQVTLRLDGKAWLPARLCEVDGNVGVEILSGPVAPSALPEGTTRLSIVLGQGILDSAQIPEIAQVGAFWDSGIPLGDIVQMIINKDKVSEARLCSFEGRFAISVL